MCLIIHNPDGLAIDRDIIDLALTHNPDGFGIFYHDTGEIKRTMSYDTPFKLCAGGRPFTAHFRYSTSGKVGKKQCHPFKINDRFALMQNGTVEHLRSATEVDTARLAKALSTIPPEHWQAVLETHPCRFAVLDRDTGAVQIANHSMWLEYEGCLYSKPDVLEEYEEMQNPTPRKPYRYERYTPSNESRNEYVWPRDVWDAELEEQVETDPWDGEWEAGLRGNSAVHAFEEDTPVAGSDRKRHVVAVYGTLKQGHGNHENYLGDACYLGSGHTKDCYPLVVPGLPFLLDKRGSGFNVEVEVYRVSNMEFNRLDGLEGHPDWYQRKQIPIVLDGGGIETKAWVYLMPDLSYDTGIYQSAY